MPSSVTGLSGDVLVAFDEFVRAAAIFSTDDFAFTVAREFVFS